ncbi:MAG TPA: hypothetical protein VF651_01865 [Gammaproteobacteria bacterium]
MKATAIVSLLLVAASLSACSSAPPPGYVCPGTVAGFQPNDATSAEVEHCLGTPDRKTQEQDGRYSYWYQLKDDVSATFLFSSGGRLISVTSPAPP